MKSTIKILLAKLGYEIRNTPPPHKALDQSDVYSDISPGLFVIDKEKISAVNNNIPGMISPLAGEELFSLCYMQEAIGDVVEIGSWQGRSTCYLARAVRESHNGRLIAIDHFKGNVGKEQYYKVGEDDLSDLEAGFNNNIAWAGYSDTVELLNMPNHDAVNMIREKSIRFIFIDGDHTKSGVEKDISLFFDKLIEGAIVVFDDYDKSFPGLIDAVNDLLRKFKVARKYCVGRTLVIRL